MHSSVAKNTEKSTVLILIRLGQQTLRYKVHVNVVGEGREQGAGGWENTEMPKQGEASNLEAEFPNAAQAVLYMMRLSFISQQSQVTGPQIVC